MAGVSIVDVDAFSTAVTVNPVDAPNSASVLECTQALANRTRYTYERSGARVAATLSALVAVTGQTDGQVVRVPRYGLYSYEATPTGLVEAPPLVIASSSSGLWVHESLQLRRRRLLTPGAAVHRWLLSEPSGDFLNSVAIGEDLSPSSTPPSRAQRGVIGRGIYADLYTGASGTGITAVTGTTMTVSCWCLIHALGFFSLSSAGRIAARWRVGYNDTVWRLDTSMTGELIGAVKLASRAEDVITGPVLPLGVPLHIAMVFGDSGLFQFGLRLFVNGNEVGNALSGGPPASLDNGAGTKVQVGGETGEFQASPVIVEDLMIENTNVSADVIRDRYLQGIGLVEEA